MRMLSSFKRASVLIVFFLVAILAVTTSKVFALEDASVPKGSYYFISSDTLSNSSGAKLSFKEIIKKKQIGMSDAMVSMEKNKYSDTSLVIDLDTNKDYNFWSTDPSVLYGDNSDTLMYVRVGSLKYTLFIPRGLDDEGRPINVATLKSTIKAIQDFKDAVNEGIIAGSLSSSYNVYSMYPDKQVPVNDILEPAKDENDRDLGYKSIKTSGVKMNYSLDYYFHPLFGKMDKAAVLGDSVAWGKFANRIVMTPITGSDGKADLSVDPDFFKFTQSADGEKDVLTTIKSSDVGSDRVKGWQAKLSGRWGNPSLVVDGTMRLAVPYVFTKDVDTGNYSVDEKEGYRTVNDVRLLISRSWVYTGEDNSFKKAGDFALFGIDTSKMTLFYSYEKDANGKTRKVGAVIPSEYQEAVFTGADGVSITGRKIILSNEYTSKLTLDTKNKDLFAVNTPTTGRSDVLVRNYAFEVDATPEKGTGHKALGTSPNKFQLRGDFSGDVGEVSGFLMYINNAYINNEELLNWLDTGEAKALKGVNAESLASLIKGDFNVGASDLSYSQFQSLADIRAELDADKSLRLMKAFYYISITFGWVLIVYTVVLSALYWWDLNNPLFEISLFNYLTFKKMYPIRRQADLDFMIVRDDVKYITLPKLYMLVAVCLVVGILFMNGYNILNLLVSFYFWITGLFGKGV